MDKKQMEVVHNGKSYYGCCNLCETKRPEDEDAESVIAIAVDNEEAYYFENSAG